MIRPQRCLSIEPITCWMHRYADVRFVFSTVSQSARFMRITSWSRVMPALFTRMSILPNCPSADLIPDFTCSSSATSMTNADALPPEAAISATRSSSFWRLRAATATVAPSRASASAQARPMPCDAPVTSATRPSNFMSAPWELIFGTELWNRTQEQRIINVAEAYGLGKGWEWSALRPHCRDGRDARLSIVSLIARRIMDVAEAYGLGKGWVVECRASSLPGRARRPSLHRIAHRAEDY